MRSKKRDSARPPKTGAVRIVRVGPYEVGRPDRPFLLIAGPCVIESEKHALVHARRIRAIADAAGLPFVFKSSYDKANRSAGNSFRGPGLREGLRILSVVKKEVGVPVLSDVHHPHEVGPASRVLDVLQIPAFLCRQTDLIVEAAKSGKCVNVKKGQFLAPQDMGNIVEKIRRAGNQNILLTERGASFGYHTLVTDFRSLVILREFGVPVIFDATHSVQQPGALGGATGGERRFVAPLARAAVAVGCDGVFMEVHEDPDRAPSDGPNMVRLRDLEALLRSLVALRRARDDA